MARRVFLGIPLTEEVTARVAPFIAALQKTEADCTFVSLENLHITVKFLGMVEEPVVEEIIGYLRGMIAEFHSFPIQVREVGVFPHPERISVVWIGASGGELVSLFQTVNRVLDSIRKSDHREHPHITIARMKSGKNKEHLQQLVEEWKDRSFGEMTVDKVVLYESQLTPSGPVYRPLQEFILA